MNGTMKTNMNSIICLVVASLLVVAMVATAIPNAIEAKKSHQWCGSFGCADNKADCQRVNKQGDVCVKTPI